MRPHHPAQTRAGAPSANRIRERYLHQLGLQRGSAPPQLNPPSQRVVVIGLPSLPEDQTANLQLESHDFSNYKGEASQDSEMGDSSRDDSLDSGSAGKRPAKECVPMTSLALSYPTALLKPPRAGEASKGISFARCFSKPRGPEAQHGDQDSVTSSTTSTTAESSFSTMVSRDWGAAPAAAPNAEYPGGEGRAPSSAALRGVHFRCGHPRLLGNTPAHCATSSLAHALNRFNIDSDCDASVASNSVVGGNSVATEDEDANAMDEDDASVRSHASFVSAGSTGHVTSARGRGRKAGKAQRLLDRAAAHERILQIRNEQSQKTRASLVHSQRMGHQETAETRSRSNSASSRDSVPLLHVQHGAPQDGALKPHPQLAYGDLSRTPTASNCSDPRKLLQGLQVPNSLLYLGPNSYVPPGVHVATNPHPEKSTNINTAETLPGKPLQFHPRLASGIPPPPATNVATPDEVESNASPSASRDGAGLPAHRRQSSVDDVLEVVEALSRLKGRGRVSGAMIPRFR